MPSKAPRPTYRLRVTLLGMEPPIWRTMWVPSSIKLCCLHSALQVVMGWTDSHLHQFEQDGKNWVTNKESDIPIAARFLAKLISIT